MAKANLTAERLRELLHYDPETGVFTRLRKRKKFLVGERAGSVSKDGYTLVGIDGEQIPAHRLAWFYVYGRWPSADIDHINGVRADNRISNLRDVSRSVNLQNQKRSRGAKSGLLGAYQQTKSRRWCSYIKAGGRTVQLGTYDTPEEAHAAYLEAKRKLHEGCTI